MSGKPGATAPTARQRLGAEALGTALLLAAVVGSGVMAERLAGGNLALTLLANALATAAALYVLIELFGPVSGAHFNPLVSLALTFQGRLATRWFVPYLLAQTGGAVLGVWLVHAMFELDTLQFSSRARGGHGVWLAEAVATAGLLLVVLRTEASRAAAMVACYIGAAYWFTASTSFANPAATVGRMFSDSFAGIAPASVPGFVLAQVIGAGLGLTLHRALPRPA